MINGVMVTRKLGLPWRSKDFNVLVKNIDRDMAMAARIGRGRRKAPIISRADPIQDEVDPKIPVKLCRQLFDPEFLQTLSEPIKKELLIREEEVLDEQGDPKA